MRGEGGGQPNAYVSIQDKSLKLQEIKTHPLNKKKNILKRNCNCICNFCIVFIFYLSVNIFKWRLPRLWRKIYAKRGGVIQILCQHLGGVSKILCMLIRGGGGVKKPQKYAYIICERPLKVIIPTYSFKLQGTDAYRIFGSSFLSRYYLYNMSHSAEAR